ncbi:MAG: MTH1187 family thiamine-binding protein [Candidatus Sericytochromatia bacterium]|nr:MTH1187 family thiamine-binding protein [Candidatus Sericytochromatia bacterium]
MVLVAELTVIPAGGVQDTRRYVEAAVAKVRASGLLFEVDALGTTLQGELDDVLRVAREAHRAVLAAGAGRVFTEIRLDERAGQALTIARETLRYRGLPLLRSAR